MTAKILEINIFINKNVGEECQLYRLVRHGSFESNPTSHSLTTDIVSIASYTPDGYKYGKGEGASTKHLLLTRHPLCFFFGNFVKSHTFCSF